MVLRRTSASGSLLLVLTVVLPGAASASSRRGFILQLDEGRAIVDLGRKDGLQARMPVRINKRYVLTHPVTHAKIEDELPLGRGVVVRVSERIASIDLGKIQKARVGDIVVFGRAQARSPAMVDGQRIIGCGACRRDEQALAVHAAWILALQQDVAGRRDAWRAFLQRNPKTPYREYVRRELAFLASLDEREPGLELRLPPSAGDRSLDRLYEGEPFEPAIILPLRARTHLKVVYLFHRRPGAPVFERMEMREDGDGYYRARLAPGAVRRPGLEYFVEAVDVAGRGQSVLGSSKVPERLEVSARAVRPDERANRSRLAFSFSQVDFYLQNASHDFYWKMESSFTYRVDFHALRYFKLGFGFFEGYGGDAVRVEQIGEGGPGALDALAFGFVYLEPEIELHEYFAISPRLTVGQIDRLRLGALGTNVRRGEQIFGAHGFLRIGSRKGSHLLIGGGHIQDAGFETQITMNLAIWDRTPLSLSALVTNVPVNREIGLILRAQLSRQINDWLEVGAHVGFAARNINHTGIGVGTTVAFQW